MLHVRLCTIHRENPDEAFGFELWRSRRKSTSSTGPSEQDDQSDLLIVKSVYPGSPAHTANLKEGDKIIAVDGTNVRDAKSVRELLGNALDVRVMVERWEGPNIPVVDRKASTPTATQRAVRPQPSESNRRRSTTLRNTLDATMQVHQWPRNYGLAQNYPSSSDSSTSGQRTPSAATARQIVLNSQVSTIDEHFPKSHSYPEFAGRRLDGSVSTNRSQDEEESEGSEARRSILDACPEGRFLLNIAGRGFYSDDLRD